MWPGPQAQAERERQARVTLGDSKRQVAEKFGEAALPQTESGTPDVEDCRKLGVSEQTFYRWKQRFAGIAELRRLQEVEDENRRLKQLVVDLTLDKQILREVVLVPEPRRDRGGY